MHPGLSTDQALPLSVPCVLHLGALAFLLPSPWWNGLALPGGPLLGAAALDMGRLLAGVPPLRGRGGEGLMMGTTAHGKPLSAMSRVTPR